MVKLKGLDKGLEYGMGGILMIIALVAVIIVGWIKNINKLAECDFETPLKCEIYHSVGLIPVVGAFTGYMDFGK